MATYHPPDGTEGERAKFEIEVSSWREDRDLLSYDYDVSYDRYPNRPRRISFRGPGLDGTLIVWKTGNVKITPLRDPAPKWQIGDVVVLQSAKDAVGETWLRIPSGWRSTHGGYRDDSYIDGKWHEGLVTPVLRNGKPWNC